MAADGRAAGMVYGLTKRISFSARIRDGGEDADYSVEFTQSETALTSRYKDQLIPVRQLNLPATSVKARQNVAPVWRQHRR
jgi:hypothetical protein